MSWPNGHKSLNRDSGNISNLSYQTDINSRLILTVITNYSQASKMDHRAVLAFTDQCTDLGTRPEPFTLAFCEWRAHVLYPVLKHLKPVMVQQFVIY